MTTNFFSPLSFVAVFGSGIRDPGSGMGKNQDPGSGINIPDSQHCHLVLPFGTHVLNGVGKYIYFSEKRLDNRTRNNVSTTSALFLQTSKLSEITYFDLGVKHYRILFYFNFIQYGSGSETLIKINPFFLVRTRRSACSSASSSRLRATPCS